jgi:hypothetical protein
MPNKHPAVHDPVALLPASSVVIDAPIVAHLCLVKIFQYDAASGDELNASVLIVMAAIYGIRCLFILFIDLPGSYLYDMVYGLMLYL